MDAVDTGTAGRTAHEGRALVTLARVVANIVSTEKHPHYKGQKILVVQPVDPEGKPKGKSLVAVDGVQAGIGDLVLVVDEGGSARAVIGDEIAGDDPHGDLRHRGPRGYRDGRAVSGHRIRDDADRRTTCAAWPSGPTTAPSRRRKR